MTISINKNIIRQDLYRLWPDVRQPVWEVVPISLLSSIFFPKVIHTRGYLRHQLLHKYLQILIRVKKIIRCWVYYKKKDLTYIAQMLLSAKNVGRNRPPSKTWIRLQGHEVHKWPHFQKYYNVSKAKYLHELDRAIISPQGRNIGRHCKNFILPFIEAMTPGQIEVQHGQRKQNNSDPNVLYKSENKFTSSCENLVIEKMSAWYRSKNCSGISVSHHKNYQYLWCKCKQKDPKIWIV